MSCVKPSTIEAWLTGKNPQALDVASWEHLKTCPICSQAIRLALALKTSAAAPQDSWTSNLSSHFNEDTPLSFLDGTMEESERLDFERHLAACRTCRELLLRMEWEIADSAKAQSDVPLHLLAKARGIGEAEIARHETKGWMGALDKVLAPVAGFGVQPRWVGAAAVVLVVVATSFFYFRLHPAPGKVAPQQQVAQREKAPGPTVVSHSKAGLGTTAVAGVNAATVERVQKILNRIERVADGLRSNQIRLDVVNSDQYIAEISPQGKLTISTQYIAAAKDDDELAFLLAHEVAHLQHPANCILSFSTSSETPVNPADWPKEKGAELQADRMGVFLASVAGYHADAAKSLLSRIQHIPRIADAAHPEFKARLQETADEVSSVVRSIELFRVGVSFFNTEQYSRSVAVFGEVAKLFPSREAFNDYGLAYHKLALEYSAENWGFKKSVILDPVARAIEPTREDLPQANLFSQFLAKAVIEYRQALARDPSYVAGRINLASALDDQGSYDAAVRELKRVLMMNPSAAERARALNNLGVIACKQAKYSDASDFFTRAVQTDPSFADPHFNLARVLELRNQPQAAVREYGRYAQLAGNERDGWLRMAYSKLNRPWPQNDTDALEVLPKLGRIRLGDSVSSVTRRLGPPTVTWKLETPTQLYFFVSLFENGGVVISGSEDMIDFVQTTPAFVGRDSANHLSEGLRLDALHDRLRTATRISLPGSRESFVDFDRGVGVNFRDARLDTWYVFAPLV